MGWQRTCARSGRRVKRRRDVGLARAPLWAALALVAVVYAVPTAADSAVAEDGVPGRETLRRAFANRYDLSATQRVQLIIRNPSGAERRRVVNIATKTIDGRLHSLGRFTEPDYLRGTAILLIENRDRSDDHFVYLPSQQRVRRVSSAQRADAFMGTDFIYEDFARRTVDDYAVALRGPATIEGEDVDIVAARPLYDSAYLQVEFLIASSDAAILEVRYYQGPREEPVKILRAPRSEMRTFHGHVLPTRMVMENRLRRTVSEARFDHITVDPPLDDTLFTTSALEAGRAIPITASESTAGSGG